MSVQQVGNPSGSRFFSSVGLKNRSEFILGPALMHIKIAEMNISELSASKLLGQHYHSGIQYPISAFSYHFLLLISERCQDRFGTRMGPALHLCLCGRIDLVVS